MIGEKLKTALFYHNMTQKELAQNRRIGYRLKKQYEHQMTIDEWMNGN